MEWLEEVTVRDRAVLQHLDRAERGGRLVERLLQRGTVADVGGETLRGDLVAAQLVGQGIRVDLTAEIKATLRPSRPNRRPTAAPPPDPAPMMAMLGM